MDYLTAILKLLPYIAAGVQVIHQDASAGQKTQIVTDALSLATAGSQQVLTGENAEMAATIGSAATEAVSTIVNALHNTASTSTQKAA
jgi:hypothetical protein